MAVDVRSVNLDRFAILQAGHVAGAEGHFLQQTLKQGMQATGTDVLGLLVDLPGDLRQALDAVRQELDGQAFGFQQLTLLLG